MCKAHQISKLLRCEGPSCLNCLIRQAVQDVTITSSLTIACQQLSYSGTTRMLGFSAREMKLFSPKMHPSAAISRSIVTRCFGQKTHQGWDGCKASSNDALQCVGCKLGGMHRMQHHAQLRTHSSHYATRAHVDLQARQPHQRTLEHWLSCRQPSALVPPPRAGCSALHSARCEAWAN